MLQTKSGALMVKFIQCIVQVCVRSGFSVCHAAFGYGFVLASKWQHRRLSTKKQCCAGKHSSSWRIQQNPAPDPEAFFDPPTLQSPTPTISKRSLWPARISTHHQNERVCPSFGKFAVLCCDPQHTECSTRNSAHNPSRHRCR